MNFIFIILTFLISAVIARILIPRILLISLRKKLFDIPDDRKIHKRAIPRLGGVSFFPTTLFAFCLVYAFRLLDGNSISTLYASYLLPELLLFACGMTLLYLTGIADDLVGVRYRQKFAIQIFCACLFPLSGLWINDLYGLFGIHELSAYVGTLDGDSISTLYASYLLPELLLFACGMTLLYLTGIADDLVGVRYRQKFAIQIFCACLFPLSGLWINDLYGLFGIHELSAYVGIPFTVLTVVFITNAINLIDGIDGLASGLSSVALLVFTFLFISKGLWSYAMLSAGTFGVLVPFFYYNVFGSVERARKIFMGDTGSLTLGYTLSFLAIKYSQHNTDIMPYTEGAFLIAFSTMIIPAFDVVRVVLVRIREGHSPFEPDKNHIHHKLLAIGLSPRRAMLSLLSMSCAFSAANILFVPYINNTVLLIADIVIWVGLNLWWDYLRDRK